jgi:hypothetical protein
MGRERATKKLSIGRFEYTLESKAPVLMPSKNVGCLVNSKRKIAKTFSVLNCDLEKCV